MLTTVLNIKSRLGLDAFDTADDPLLTNLLKHVSARFAAGCNRIFDYGAALAYEFRADQSNIIVDHPPVELVSKFELKSTESEGWLLQSAIGYLLSPLKTIIELAQPLGQSGQLGRITYNGGYILPGSAPVSGVSPLPDDLEQACVEQVAYWYQRRAQLGLVSVSNDSGVVQQFQSSDLLPQVRVVLRHHERWIN